MSNKSFYEQLVDLDFKYPKEGDKIDLMANPRWVAGKRTLMARKKKFFVIIKIQWNGRWALKDDPHVFEVKDTRHQNIKNLAFLARVHDATLEWVTTEIAWWGSIWMFQRLIQLERDHKALEQRFETLQSNVDAAGDCLRNHAYTV